MAISTTGLIKGEEFEQTPEWAGKQELLEGELSQLPPPEFLHNEISHQVFLAIYEYLKTSKSSSLVRAFHEMGYRIGRKPVSWLIPDVSVTHPNQNLTRYYEGGPMIAIEVISPSNTANQVAKKVNIYLEGGSREVWVLYPDLRFAWLHRDSGAVKVEDSLTTDLLPGLSIDLRTLFAD